MVAARGTRAEHLGVAGLLVELGVEEDAAVMALLAARLALDPLLLGVGPRLQPEELQRDLPLLLHGVVRAVRAGPRQVLAI